MTFLCIQCILGYEKRSDLTEHLKSKLHLYNLKRINLNLPSILPDDFEALVNNQTESGKTVVENINLKSKKKLNGYSNKRKDEVHVVSKEEEVEASNDNVSQDYIEIPNFEEYDTCLSLFNNHRSQSFEANWEYMFNEFSFVVPEVEYCIDVEGFIQFLGEKVYSAHVCLFCDQIFDSRNAVQQHMFDKGHRRIGLKLDTQIEDYADFYDYSSSYKNLNLPDYIKNKLKDTDNNNFTEKSKDDLKEENWVDKLTEAGYKKPYRNEYNNLCLPLAGLEVINRKNVSDFKAYQSLNENSTIIPASTNKSIQKTENTYSKMNPEERKLFRKAIMSASIKKNETEMKLGVKANGYYRYIVRKNKIFL